MLSEKYLPDATACLTQIQKQDELKLMKLLIKSRKEKIINNKSPDPIYSQVYVGWDQSQNNRKLKKRIKTQVQLGQKSNNLQSSFREILRDRDSSNLHSKSVQLPFLAKKGFKIRSRNQSGRASDFVMSKPQEIDKFEPTRTDHKQTEKMRRKLVKVLEHVYQDPPSQQKQQKQQKQIRKKQKNIKNSPTKKLKLDRITKGETAIPKHIRQWHRVDILKLQTYFLKLLTNKQQHEQSKTNIEEMREQSSFEKMSIPKKQKIPDYIRQYKTINPHLEIDDLIKNPDFQIVIDDDEVYFGCVANGKRVRTGICVSKNSRFEGEWANDSKYQGYEVTPQGYYKGKFKDGLRNGQGIFVWKNGEKYEGQWRNGCKHGSGIWKSDKGDSYIGQWNFGKVQGQGVHISANGQRYEGSFHNFLKHGHGKQSFPNGDIYEGEYKSGKPSGKGKYTWKNQIVYQGQFVQGYRHGKGMLLAEGYMKFVGNFVGEKPEGKGQIIYENGDSFIGHFKEGEKHGKGTMKYKNSHKIITGFWRNDEREFEIQD